MESRPVAAAGYGLVLLFVGALNHPVLKALYNQGDEYKAMKNTVTVVDLIFVLLLFTSIVFVRAWYTGESVFTDARLKLRLVAIPALCFIGAITLSTLATALDMYVFTLSAGAELVFGVLMVSHVQNIQPTKLQILGCALAVAGVVCLSLGKLQTGGPQSLWPGLLAALAFRLSQGAETAFLRPACVKLQGDTLRHPSTVLEITTWKMWLAFIFCVPYALITEGVTPWSTLVHMRGLPLGFVASSCAITALFQFSIVGLNASMNSIPVLVIQELAPFATACVAVSLGNSSFGEKLKFPPFPLTPLNASAVGLLLSACVLFGPRRRCGRRLGPPLQQPLQDECSKQTEPAQA